MASSASHHNDGQRHDRIPVHTDRSIAPPGHKLKNTSLDEDVTISQKMLSAVTGSILTSLLVTPLDVVRVRLQSQQSSAPSAPAPTNLRGITPSQLASFTNLPQNVGVTQCCREVFWVTNNTPFCVAGPSQAYTQSVASSLGAECVVEETQRKTFSSTLDGLRKIARHEGLSTLWRGLSPTLAMAVPGNVIYFAGYDWLRTSQFSPLTSNIPDVYAPLIAGSSARVLAAFFVSPIELFRTRLQASNGVDSAAQNFRDTMTGVRDMTRSQGYHTLWRGLTLTLWRDVPFSALYWWGYEAGRNVLTDARERRRGRLLAPADAPVDSTQGGSIARRRAGSRSRQGHATTMMDSFIAGAASGGAAAVVTTPFDVGKTRQQVFRHAGDVAASSSSGAGSAEALGTNVVGAQAGRLGAADGAMLRLLWRIFQDEGVAGLFRGWGARCLKVAPACAIMISSYEMGKKMAMGPKAGDEDGDQAASA